MPPSNAEGYGQKEIVLNNSAFSQGTLSHDNTPADIRTFLSRRNNPYFQPWTPNRLRAQSPHYYSAIDQPLHQHHHIQNYQSFPPTSNTHSQLSNEYPATSVSGATSQFRLIAPKTTSSMPLSSTPDPWPRGEVSHTKPLRNQSGDDIACDRCGMTFKGKYRRGNRTRHLRSKHGNQRVMCRVDLCYKTFQRCDARSKHEKNIHHGLNRTSSSANQDDQSSQPPSQISNEVVPSHILPGSPLQFMDQSTPFHAAPSAYATSIETDSQILGTESSYLYLPAQTGPSSIFYPTSLSGSHHQNSLAGTALEVPPTHHFGGRISTDSSLISSEEGMYQYIDPSLILRR